VIVVGEGPGREEDLTGRPFVGRAGGLLDALLASVGLGREDVYVTNVVKDRATTGGDRPRDRPPTPQEIAACASWLTAQVALLRPRIVVTLGRYALEAFLPGAQIKDVHGRSQRRGGMTILPLYHPSYALHNPNVRPLLFRDIQALAALLHPPAEVPPP
jgi:uracil-DNA glycosylase family 4